MLRLLLVANEPALDPRIVATFERDGVSLSLPTRRDGLAESVAADPPDAAALDLGMPDDEGWRLLRSLRERLDSSSLPIVGLTSKDTAEERLRAFSLGADDVMRNPFDAHELVLRTRGVVAAQRDRSAALRGSLEIYPLPGLLQSCERSSCTGLLKISNGDEGTLIRFHKGKIIAAEAGEQSGLPVLWSALADGLGDFVLTVDPAQAEDNFGFPGQSMDAPPPLVPSVRGLLIDLAWASEEESDEPQILFPDELPTAWEPAVEKMIHPETSGVSTLPVFSLFYAPSTENGLRGFLAVLPSTGALPNFGAVSGERRISWGEGTEDLLLRYDPLSPSTVSAVLGRARTAAGIVLWLGSDLSAGGVPMALRLLQTAARGAERLILVVEPVAAGAALVAETEAPERWTVVPGDPFALAALLRESLPSPVTRAAKREGAS